MPGFTRLPINWQWLMTAAPGLVRRAHERDILQMLPGPVYMASPISSYLARGEPDLALARAAEWQAWLLDLGISSIAPACLTLPPLLARGDDPVGLSLQRLGHAEWMARCLPWMAASSACVIPPIDGWDHSTGVWQEAMWFAREAARPVWLIKGAPE